MAGPFQVWSSLLPSLKNLTLKDVIPCSPSGSFANKNRPAITDFGNLLMGESCISSLRGISRPQCLRRNCLLSWGQRNRPWPCLPGQGQAGWEDTGQNFECQICGADHNWAYSGMASGSFCRSWIPARDHSTPGSVGRIASTTWRGTSKGRLPLVSLWHLAVFVGTRTRVTPVPPATSQEAMKRNPKLEVLHLFRWFTHTPRCPGAFPEDAKPVTDQIDQNASKLQVVAASKEEIKIYVLWSSGISEDAARCWANTSARIAKWPARWARPSCFKDSELKGGTDGHAGDAMLRACKIESLPAGSWRKVLCRSQASWVIGTGGCDNLGKAEAASVVSVCPWVSKSWYGWGSSGTPKWSETHLSRLFYSL